MPNLEQTPNILTQAPEQLTDASSTPQTKLFVVAFKDFSIGEPAIITQQGGRLFAGMLTGVPIERDANEITRKHQITTTAYAHLHLRDGPIPHTQGYSVERATHSPLPNMADFTNHPTPTDHDLPLEIHLYSQLIKRLSSQPERETELAYLRAFGDFVINRTR